jgi:hypothetical protein
MKMRIIRHLKRKALKSSICAWPDHALLQENEVPPLKNVMKTRSFLKE